MMQRHVQNELVNPPSFCSGVKVSVSAGVRWSEWIKMEDSGPKAGQAPLRLLLVLGRPLFQVYGEQGRRNFDAPTYPYILLQA
jgi:hypothetical protein